jgi:PAS domain S-box-containing protein
MADIGRTIAEASERVQALRSAREHRDPTDPWSERALDELEGSLGDSIEALRVAEEDLATLSTSLAAAREREQATLRRYRDLFENAPCGCLLTDPHGVILEANQAAATLLSRRVAHLLGKPLPSLFSLAARWPMRTLLTHLLQDRTHEAPTTMTVEWQADGRRQRLEVAASPIRDLVGDDRVRWILRELPPVAPPPAGDRPPGTSDADDLRSVIDELRAEAEVLHESIEALETTNQELQSNIEELEISGDASEHHAADLEQQTTRLEAILRGLPAAVAVVGPDLIIRHWSARAEELWGAASDAIGSSLRAFDRGFPGEALVPLVRRMLDPGNDAEAPAPVAIVPAVGRDGRRFECEVRCVPVVESNATTGVTVFLHPILSPIGSAEGLPVA